MFFNSFAFIGFFLIVVVLVFATKFFRKPLLWRNLILLITSYWFYGYFNIGFTLILAFVTAINFIGGNLLFKAKDTQRKSILAITTILSLLPLVFFKYAVFLVNSLSQLLQIELRMELLDGLLLPVGISFFTFQALSYTIDIYRSKLNSPAFWLDFALFVAFFPTILSGPIEKARNLLPQIKRYFLPTGEDFIQGTCIFVWGLFKKMVVADRLAEYVDYIYYSASWESGSSLALAAAFYSIQIYCDFSGYSDMALGAAKALGFNVTKNFRQPYFSHTIKEFWRKWHIALTSWFTEYVYFSLGGSRVKTKARWVFNISTIFILSGIWHGAAWNFLIWGALHACYYLIEHFAGFQRKDLRWNWLSSAIGGIVVFVLVTIAWIFFRIPTFEKANFIIGKIFTSAPTIPNFGSSTFAFAGTVAMFLVMIVYELLVRKHKLCFDVENYNGKITANLLSLIPLIILMAMFGITSDKFVYFQF